MSESACNGMKIRVINSNVRYTDGQPAPIVITAAGPLSSQSGLKGGYGYLQDASGNNPPEVPITVPFNETYTFTAGSSEGSNGKAEGTITIQCQYTTSTNPNGGTPQPITVGYSGDPKTINSKGCNGTATQPTYQSTNFTVT